MYKSDSNSSSSANSKPTTNTGNSSSGGSSSGTGNKPFNSTYGDNTKDKEENLVKKDTLNIVILPHTIKFVFIESSKYISSIHCLSVYTNCKSVILNLLYLSIIKN